MDESIGNHDREFARFLHISLGSLAEVDTQLTIVKELRYITKEDFACIEPQIYQLRKMIYGLLKSLKLK